MSEQIFNTRIVHKHDTEANWNKATNFIPKQGELIVYDIDDNYGYQRLKIGDGVTYVRDLVFMGETVIYEFLDERGLIKQDVLPEGFPYLGWEFLLEETDAYIIDDEIFSKTWVVDETLVLNLNETYEVVYNGKPYFCISQPVPEGFGVSTSGVVLGNLSPVTGGTNTGEPFAMVCFPNEGGVRILDFAGAQSVRLGIKGEVVYQIDEKYIPRYSELQDIVEVHTSQLDSLTESVVRYDRSQNLHPLEQELARENIGAIGINDIPEIPEIPEQVQADLSETDKLSPAFVKGILKAENTPASLPSVGWNFFSDSYSTHNLNWVQFNNEAYYAQIEYTEDLRNQIYQMATSEDGIGYVFNTSDSNIFYFSPLFLEYGGDGEILTNRERTMSIMFTNSTLTVFLYSSSMPNYTTIAFGQLKTHLALSGHRELHPSIIPSFVARKTDVSEAIETLRESLDNLASKTYVDTSIASLVNSAPETLDTLGELATAMEENESVVNALNQAIANKADNSTVTQLQQDVNEKAENSALNEHTSNTTVHITAVERTTWNAKMDVDAELISIADIDTICGSVTPIAEVLF